jgi:regulator of sigma E protease
VRYLLTLLAAVFVFGLLIAGHELGHFSAAKASGVKVLEYAIGMGPKLFGFKSNETEYTLRIFPIGGFCKMLGEDGSSEDPGAFCNQSPWRRLIIIIAGAFMNFLIAIVLLSIVTFNIGITKPVIAKLDTNYPAVNAGLKVNDKILYVNDVKIKSFDDFRSFVSQNKDKEFNVTVERDGKNVTASLKPLYDKSLNEYRIGIEAKVEKGNFIESIGYGFKDTFSILKQMIAFLGSLFKGKVSTNDLGGPVAIIKFSGEAAKLGILSLLSFTAYISINLGIINLLPFPALDGGWVIILLYEAISGRKVDENKIGIVNLVGFSILIAFAIFITFKDIMRLGTY